MRFHFHATSRPATFDIIKPQYTSMFSIRDGLPVLLALRVRVQPLHLRQRRGLGRRRHQGRHGKSRLTQEMNEQSTMNVKEENREEFRREHALTIQSKKQSILVSISLQRR